MKIGNVFITGANRGIGYEFVRQLILREDPPKIIFATYRSGSTVLDLKALQDNAVRTKLILIKMDVNAPEEIEVAKKIVEANTGDEGLHLLINNAGIFEILPLEHMTVENLEKHFKTNTVGPMMLSKVMQPFLEKAVLKNDGYKVVLLSISSLLGSITNTGNNFFDLNVPSYKISKAALNMAMKILASTLKDKGILVAMINPGWVKTDMGNRDLAEITPEESISAMLKTLEQINRDHHGAFIDRFGKTIPF
uniref:C-factor n=1 Tax=Parasteatoda tepidariorum TaxID=114398 RepID=A0A2L2YDE2_PARTP